MKCKVRKKKRTRCDETCSHFIYVGEGGFICDKEGNKTPAVLVVEDWIPTENNLWCQGVKHDKDKT